MKKELEKIREGCMLEISCWGGLGPCAGVNGMIIKDNEIYYYHDYFRMTKFLTDNNIPQSSLTHKELSGEKIERIKKIIEEYIDIKKEALRIFDASFKIFMRLDEKENSIVNQHELYSEIKNKIEGVLKDEEEVYGCSISTR